jgi:hypothetical protein
MNIRDQELLLSYVGEKWPDEVLAILKSESKIPASLLRVGVMSKFFMMLSYFKNRPKIR